jgi:predicted heme/steroid binding protein
LPTFLENSFNRKTQHSLAVRAGVAKEPIYIAVKGRVFDVSTGGDFYGPEGGGYNALAGEDASRALGIMSLQGREAWLEDCRIRKVRLIGNFKICDVFSHCQSFFDWKKQVNLSGWSMQSSLRHYFSARMELISLGRC